MGEVLCVVWVELTVSHLYHWKWELCFVLVSDSGTTIAAKVSLYSALYLNTGF